MHGIALFGLLQAVGPQLPAADDGCARDPGAITVCARAPEQSRYRLPRVPDWSERPGPPPAETGLFGNVRGGVATEQTGVGPGAVSNRVMARIKIPLGR